jgi:CopG antitoxin of type II toxin-antitoxin system
MARKQHPTLEVIEDLADIPVFTSEAEEAAYWGTHTLSEQLLTQMRPLSEADAPRPRKSRATSIRMDEGLLERLQALADQAHRPYQSLLKQFLAERIELEESKAQQAAAVAHQNELLQTILYGNLSDVEIPVKAQFPHLPAATATLSFSGTLTEANRARVMSTIKSAGVDPTQALEQLARRVADILAEDDIRKHGVHIDAIEDDTLEGV